MLDAFFDQYYRLHPVNATFTGVHDYDDRLPDWSPEGLERAVSLLRTVGRSLPPDAEELPPWPDRADLRLAAGALQIRLAELEGHHFERRNPALFTGEAVFGVISLVLRDFGPPEPRLRSAIARLRDLPQFLDGAGRTLAGARVPLPWIARAVRECEGGALFLERGLTRWIADRNLPAALANEASEAARLARGAFDEFSAWMTRDLAESADARVACGEYFFDLLLQKGHWCATSAASLLEDARAAFDEAAGRLTERANAVASGGWPAVQEQLGRHHPTADGYLSAFASKWQACRTHSEAADLVTWPEYPIRYVPFPPHVRDAAPFLYFLNYRSPAPFDAISTYEYLIPGIDHLPSDRQREVLSAVNDSVITLNHVVHHGALGHHVQNFYAYQSDSKIGRVAAVDCASRINLFCGGSMAEGWACYATDLMDEAGFLSPLEQVAEQHTRLRLLARAIVDIEVHCNGLTMAEAEAFYRDRVGMAPAAAVGEATRNAMFPGAAVMYWLGTRAIHDLRRRVERRQGASFSLKGFHDRLLSYGSIPVLLIDQLMAVEDEGRPLAAAPPGTTRSRQSET